MQGLVCLTAAGVLSLRCSYTTDRVATPGRAVLCAAAVVTGVTRRLYSVVSAGTADLQPRTGAPCGGGKVNGGRRRSSFQVGGEII